MSILKPVPVLPPRVVKMCPVCGTASYSREGIHPQCAIRQADEPRNKLLQQERKEKAKAAPPKQRAWNRKQGPGSPPVSAN